MLARSFSKTLSIVSAAKQSSIRGELDVDGQNVNQESKSNELREPVDQDNVETMGLLQEEIKEVKEPIIV